MAEWHVTPEYIHDNWTDELFTLMTSKLAERKSKEGQPSEPAKVPDTHLFSEASSLIKVKKKHGD